MISCRHSTSGSARPSQSSRRGSRAVTEFTFHVAIRTLSSVTHRGQLERPPTLDTVAAGYRFAARPGWLVGHLAVLAAVIAMILLGHWQLTVSERKGFSLQNFGYAFQWWIFSGFAVLLWGKILRDNAHRPDPAESVTPAESAPPSRRRSLTVAT